MENNRVIAFYLPQYHPIPENDAWWGPGFTEWTNVAAAKPLFRGHVQPRIPADLGFYDLRLPETREAQAMLAREAGIEGFCYYHYWFGEGRQLLERPFNEVVASGKPDFPFCLCWANHTWASSTWTNAKSRKQGSRILMEQLYPGREDNENHFMTLLPAFRDSRYIRVDGKPLFAVFDPFKFQDAPAFLGQWRELARKHGLGDFHFVAVVRTANPTSVAKTRLKGAADAEAVARERVSGILAQGYDAVATDNHQYAQIQARGLWQNALHDLFAQYLGIRRPFLFRQAAINKYMLLELEKQENVYPTLVPNWDRTPRSKEDSIYVDSTPDEFGKLAQRAFALVADKQAEHRIVFLKSWNEWGEGNYMEPDRQYGRGYLEALRRAIDASSKAI
ncbi:MAG: glycoside hydrolase family 99-like domain-containing protein [Bacteroidales bacterium]|nr:glycoside hydrolase family 99-like domain-containing protein [Bacteroidales bacterium]